MAPGSNRSHPFPGCCGGEAVEVAAAAGAVAKGKGGGAWADNDDPARTAARAELLRGLGDGHGKGWHILD